MPLVAPTQQSSNFTPAPVGSHIARCFRMVDVGTHETTWEGKTRVSRKVRLDFELPEETHTFREEKGPEPHSVGQYFTFSMNEKAALRGLLEQWRGKPFTDEEAAKFDISVLIGKTCMMNVVHNEVGGKIYANIASLMPIPKALKGREPEPVTPTVCLSLDDLITDPSNNVWAYMALPDFIKKKIKESKEWGKVAPIVGEEGGNDESPWGEDEPQDRTDHSPKNQGRAPFEDDDSESPIPF
jgi:hypothetical protein